MCLETNRRDQSALEDPVALETSKKQCSTTGAYLPAPSIREARFCIGSAVPRSEEDRGEGSAISKSSQLPWSQGCSDCSRSGRLRRISSVSDREDEFSFCSLNFTGSLIPHRPRGKGPRVCPAWACHARPLTIAWTRAGGCRNIMKLVSLWPMARHWRQDCVPRAGHLGGGLGPSQTV